MNTAALIRARIQELPEGTPFTTSMFVELGSRAAIDQTLYRMAKAGEIQRVTRGVFVRPKESRFVGKVPPAPQEVATVIAQAGGGTAQINGAEAARRFGLSTQVPAKPVYFTNGPSRKFHIGNLEVMLRHVAPRKLVLGARPAGEALSALWYLGKQHTTPEVIAQIRSKLPPEEYEVLKGAKASMPEWMADALRRSE